MAPMTRSEEILTAILARLDRIERLIVLQHREHYDADGLGDVAPEDESRELRALVAIMAGGAA